MTRIHPDGSSWTPPSLEEAKRFRREGGPMEITSEGVPPHLHPPHRTDHAAVQNPQRPRQALGHQRRHGPLLLHPRHPPPPARSRRQKRLTIIFLLAFLVSTPTLIFSILGSTGALTKASPTEALSVLSIAGLFAPNATAATTGFVAATFGDSGCSETVCKICFQARCASGEAKTIVVMMTSLVRGEGGGGVVLMKGHVVLQ